MITQERQTEVLKADVRKLREALSNLVDHYGRAATDDALAYYDVRIARLALAATTLQNTDVPAPAGGVTPAPVEELPMAKTKTKKAAPKKATKGKSKTAGLPLPAPAPSAARSRAAAPEAKTNARGKAVRGGK